MLVTFAAIPRIPGLERSRISGIFAIAFQAFAMLPAPARLVVFASHCLGLTDLAVIRVFHNLPSLDHRFGGRRQPAQKKKMMATKTATVRKKNPAERPLQPVPNADTAEIDGSATRTSCEEHQLAAPTLGDWEARGWIKGEERSCGRLASRAALICSGLLRSGSEICSRSLARSTWRLCRFANLLSIHSPFLAAARLTFARSSQRYPVPRG